MTMKFNYVELNKKEVTVYPYRTAMVKSTLFKMENESKEDELRFDKLQEKLAKKTSMKFDVDTNEYVIVDGVVPDNHTVYKIDNLYLMFSDRTILIGTDVQVGRW